MARQIITAAVAAAVLSVGLTVSGCASVESIRDSRESGFVHRFAAPYRQVLDAMPGALEAVRLRVAETIDTSNGGRTIIARYPGSLMHLRYYVRISIKALGATQTEVEILSKQGQLADMPGSIGNSSDLFLEIGRRVYGT